MADKKIIDKKDVKENNPNDDEEILINNDDLILEADTENDKESIIQMKKTNETKQLEFPE